MIVDGKAIANQWLEELRLKVQGLDQKPRCVIFSVEPDVVTNSYLNIKQKKAAFVGIDIILKTLPKSITQVELLSLIKDSNSSYQSALVQLPLPIGLDSEAICNALDPFIDVDALSATSNFESPVVLAIKRILSHYQYSLVNKKITVVGLGRLVGKPILNWLEEEKNLLTTVTAESTKEDFYAAIAQADVIISGAGSPSLITADMIKEGVVILDAGTSESNGKITGDFSNDCQDKAYLYTPVPGGIGPVTIAALLSNIVTAHIKD